MVDGCRLMGVELLDAARSKHLSKAHVYGFGEGCVLGGTRRQPPDGGDPTVRAVRTIGKAAS